mgnify:CR=1 FL=1
MDKELIKSRLMDYLYDELNEADRKEVEKWLSENPEARRELLALQQTRELLSAVPEVEPAIPIVKISSSHSIRRRWLPLAITAAAAAILLLLIATNVSVQTHESGVIIAFGKAPAPLQLEETGADADAIQAAITANNQQLYQQLDSIQRGLQGLLVDNQTTMQQQWQRQWSAKQINYENQLQSLANEAFRKKYPELAAFVQDMQLEQEQEMRLMLTQLWNEWQRQRTEDLKTIERNFVMLNQNLELNRQGTEEMFRSMLTRTGD